MIHGCNVVSFTLTEMICQCNICDALSSISTNIKTDTSIIRQLQNVDTNIHNLEIVAMASHVWNDFSDNIITIGNQGTLEFYQDAGITTAFFSIILIIIFT
jgi:hypothetical protein